MQLPAPSPSDAVSVSTLQLSSADSSASARSCTIDGSRCREGPSIAVSCGA